MVGRLTARELSVLRRLNYHGSNFEIARDLFVSRNTVKTHIKSIYAKLGVNDRRSALAIATTLGLLDSAKSYDDAEPDTAPSRRNVITVAAARMYFDEEADALRTGDWTRYAHLHRRDARQITPVTSCDGIEAIIESNQQIMVAVPDLCSELTHVGIDSGGNRAIFECENSGTLVHPLSTPIGIIPGTGGHFRFTSVDVVTFDEFALACEIRRCWDLRELFRHQELTEL